MLGYGEGKLKSKFLSNTRLTQPSTMGRSRLNFKWWRAILLVIATVFLIILLNKTALSKATNSLPTAQIHPLPNSLLKWDNNSNDGDYFDQIKSTPLGYLVWSRFPIRVYLEKPAKIAINSASDRRFQTWVVAVREAIAEWNNYLPLAEIENPAAADIIIWRSPAKREIKLNPETGLYDIPRAIAAQTNYDFYLRENPLVIAHHMTINIDPSSLGQSLLATVRHELGHALGIWGHSPAETDALYYSQVREPQPISPRDINTLVKIYQQPTKLGWQIN